MSNPITRVTYDAIVIGAGAVGENVADRAAQGGLRTAIVEAELVGGECSYWACMPSKALLRAGNAVDAARRVGGAAEAVTGEVDPSAVLRRRNSFTSDWNDEGQAGWLEGAGIDLVRGTARLTGVKELTVTAADGSQTVLTATHAVALCTGSAALLPDVPGLAESAPWTSREATSAQSVPAEFIIIGGGVVGVEMADAYESLGARVTLLSRGPLLANQEPFAGALLAQSLRERGVDVRLDARVASVSRHDGRVSITLESGEGVSGDELLVATGRVPRTQDLGIDIVGLTPGDWLTVDDSMLVLDSGRHPIDGEWLYAVGDVNHRALLTHQGKYQARAAGDVMAARALGRPLSLEPWGAHVATADRAAVPQVTFTDPQIASIGLTAKAASDAGIRTRVVDYEIGDVAGAAVHADGYQGTARAVVDEDRGTLVGVTFVGQDVAELLHSATIAVVGEVPLDRLWHAVPSYPTISEVWLRLLETYGRPTPQ